MAILEIQNLYKSFGGVKAVRDLSLSIQRPSITGLFVTSSIIGPNGAGKTTLFNLIGGFVRQDSGTIYFRGERLDDLPPSQRALRGIGRLWQDIRLFRNMTALENLLVATKNQPGERILKFILRYGNASKAERDSLGRAVAILDRVGLAHKKNSLAQDLSYGEQKLLAIGRLLMNDADLLLLDEPTSGLSPVFVDKILDIITQLPGEGRTVLMIEHNSPKAMEVSDYVYVISGGRIELGGKPGTISKDPKLKEIYWGV